MQRPQRSLSIISQVSSAARLDCALDPTRPTVIGVSGGPDSLCLAHLLNTLQFSIIVAHFDHHLRPESTTEAQKVRSWAQEHNLPFFIGEADVLEFARNQRLSIEEAARITRYRFLFDIARQQNAQAVAVAHNADDQAETILMHLLRGAGISGLKGMLPSSLNEGWDVSIPLVRPLLGVCREDIEAYCRAEGLEPSLDPSNNDLSLYRNRLRHRLLPELETYNPQIRQVLWRTGRTLAGDAQIIETALAAAWQTCRLDGSTSYVALDWAALRTMPVGLQRNLLRKAIESLRPGLRDLDFEIVERGVRFINEPTRTRRVNLALGLQLFLEPPRLFLAENEQLLPIPADWPQLDGAVKFNVPGRISIGRGWVIESYNFSQPWVNLVDPWQVCMDFDQIDAPLELRPLQAADRFRPFGLNGKEQKVSDFFINQGLPRRARAKWPLLFCGTTLAWVPGFRPAEDFRIRENTTSKVYIRCRRPETSGSD